MFYESLLLFAVAFFAGWVFFFASGGRDATAGLLRHALQLFILVVFAAYFLWCWLRGGQTLAMKAWRTAVLRRDRHRCVLCGRSGDAIEVTAVGWKGQLVFRVHPAHRILIRQWAQVYAWGCVGHGVDS